MPLGRRSVQIGSLRVCVAGANCSPPPLAESRHRGIMTCHSDVQAPNPPPFRTQTYAQFRLFTGNQILAETTNSHEGLDACHEDPTTRTNFSNQTIPFAIA